MTGVCCHAWCPWCWGWHSSDLWVQEEGGERLEGWEAGLGREHGTYSSCSVNVFAMINLFLNAKWAVENSGERGVERQADPSDYVQTGVTHMCPPSSFNPLAHTSTVRGAQGWHRAPTHITSQVSW